MSKLLKITLLLSVLMFVVNCQVKHTSSKFQEIEENAPLIPGFQPPKDSDSEIEEGNKPTIPGGSEKPDTTLTRLDVDELVIANATAFNKHMATDFKPTSTTLEFLVEKSPRFDEDVLRNTDKTEVKVNITLMRRAGGNLDYIKSGIGVEYGDKNNIRIVYKEDLKKGLNELGTYAEYKVDVYIKDKRSPIQYLMTQHTFYFRVYGNNF